LALCAATLGLFAGGATADGAVVTNVLTNHSFETPDVQPTADSFGAAGWGTFNSAYTNQDFPAQHGEQTLKVFGPFFDGGGSGVVQGGFAASAGQTWEASAYLRNPSTDPIGQNNFAVVKMEFLNASNAVIGAFETSPFNSTAPTDTWTLQSVQGVAPAGTTSAQIVLVHVQIAPVDGGSVVFDNAAFGLAAPIPEPSAGVAGLVVAGWALRRRRRRC
jgi:hypothetical protein